LSGADEVSTESWQLVTAIYDKGDGLTLCDSHGVMTALILVILLLLLLELAEQIT
jgi:hypothetical protein